MARYVGGRIVPTHGGVWDGSKSYEELTIVLREDTGDSYISKRPVPAGTAITEEHYWVMYSVYNEQITRAENHLDSTAAAIRSEMNTQLQQVNERMAAAEENVNERASAAEELADTRATEAENLSNQNRTAIETRMSQIEARQEANVRASTDASADYAAEVVDARVDCSSVAHSSVGALIRSLDRRLSDEVLNVAKAEDIITVVLPVPFIGNKGIIDAEDGQIKNGYRPITKLFTIDDGATEFSVSCAGYAFRIFRYDADGNYLSCGNWITDGEEVYKHTGDTFYRIHFDALSMPNNSTSPSIETIQVAFSVKEMFINVATKAVRFDVKQELEPEQKATARNNILAASAATVENLRKRLDIGGKMERITSDYCDWEKGAINYQSLTVGSPIEFTGENYYTHCYVECETGEIYYYTCRVSNANQIFAVGTDQDGNILYYWPAPGESGVVTDYELIVPSGISRLYLCSQTTASPSDGSLFIIRKYTPYQIASVEDIPDVLRDVYQTTSVTVEQGATEGKWISLTGKNDPVVVRCDDSNVVDSYYVNCLDEDGNIIANKCNMGKWYYFPTLRNTYQIQLRAANYIKENDAAVGGEVTVLFAKADDIPISFEHIGVGAVGTLQIINGAVTVEKLSAELRLEIGEKISKDDAEGLIEAAIYDLQTDKTEEYVLCEIAAIRNELDEIQTANTSSVVWMTDLHAMAYNDNTDRTIKPMERAVAALKKIDETNAIDFYVLGGDYLWNNAQNTPRQRAVGAYQLLQKMFCTLRGQLFACKGNHDDNSIASSTLGLDAVIYPDEQYRYLGKQYEKSGVVLDAGYHERFYGYYDIPSQKIRLIFVNTVDIPYLSENDDLKYKGQGTISISEEQNSFIQEALRFDESGWAVMFFSHHGLVQSNVVPAYANQLWGVIQAYMNRTTFTQTFNTIWGSYTVDVDYTDNPSNEVIACVCGHNHADRSQVVDGALVVSTGCACPSQPSEIDGESVSPTYETATETLLDILTIDRKKGKLYATRYGLGRSREFNYNTISGEIGEITE